MYSLQLALQIDLGITLPKAFYVKKITSSKEKYICKMIINIYSYFFLRDLCCDLFVFFLFGDLMITELSESIVALHYIFKRSFKKED